MLPIQSLIAEQKQKNLNERTVQLIHDRLNTEYGWIPLEEFKKLLIPTVRNLLYEIEERHKEEERQFKKGKR